MRTLKPGEVDERTGMTIPAVDDKRTWLEHPNNPDGDPLTCISRGQ